MKAKLKESKALKIVAFVLLDLILAFILTIPVCSGGEDKNTIINENEFNTANTTINSRQFPLDKGIYKVKIKYDNEAPETKSKINFIDAAEKKENEVEPSLMPSYSKSISYRVYVKRDNQRAEIQTEGTNQSTHIRSAEIKFQKGLTRTYYMAKYAFYIFVIAFIIWFVVFGFKKFRKYNNKNIVLGILFTIGILLLPILTAKLMYGHDILFHMYRLVGIDEGFKMGQFPIRMHPNWQNGYGVAMGVTYPNIPFVIPAFIWHIGFPLITAYKSYFVISAILMVIVSYFSFEKISRNKNMALFGSIAYSLSTYHLTNMYTRQAAGENFAMIFFPLIILGFYELLRRKNARKDWSFYLVIGMTGVIVSHPLSVIMVAIFSVIICIMMISRFRNKQTVLALLKTALFTLLVNLWVIVPMVNYYMSDLLGVKEQNVYKIKESGITLKELFFGANDVNSKSPGVALMIVFILGIYFVFNAKKKAAKRGLLNSLVAVSIISLFMASEFFPYTWLEIHAKGVYDFLSKLQFSMRFLGIASAVLATLFVVILLMNKKNKKFYYVTAVVIMAFTLIQFGNYCMQCNPDKIYTDVSQLDSFGDVKNYTVQGLSKEQQSSREIVTNNSSVKTNVKSRKGTKFVLEINNSGSKESEIQLPVTPFNEYVATYDGGSLETKPSQTSKLTVVVPANFNKEVEVYYKEPITWRIAEIISLLSIIYVIYYLSKRIIDKRKNEEAEEKDDQQISE